MIFLFKNKEQVYYESMIIFDEINKIVLDYSKNNS